MTITEQTPHDAQTATPISAEQHDEARQPATKVTASNRTGLILGIIGIALVGGAIVWGFFQDEPFGGGAGKATSVSPVAAPYVSQPTLALESVPATIKAPIEAPEPETVPPEPTLTLEDSDPVIRGVASTINGGKIVNQFVAGDFIMDRAVAVLDNLQRGQVPYKLLPIARPIQKFQVIETDQGFIAAPSNTARYDSLAKWINAVDTQNLALLIVRFMPVAKEAYALLGYPREDLETALQVAINQIATTPESYPEAILSVKESVYIYVDESLEALPALQKQIMRMGDKNMAMVRNKALALQSELQQSE